MDNMIYLGDLKISLGNKKNRITLKLLHCVWIKDVPKWLFHGSVYYFTLWKDYSDAQIVLKFLWIDFYPKQLPECKVC